VGRILETPREEGNPTVPRLMFDGRKGEVSPERDGEGCLKPRGRELRAAWLKGEKEKRGPDRRNGEHSPGSAWQPTDPAGVAAADRRVGGNPERYSGLPHVSYPRPPATSPVVPVEPSYEPAPKYRALGSLTAAAARGG
jgi:hypothetical protein